MKYRSLDVALLVVILALFIASVAAIAYRLF